MDRECRSNGGTRSRNDADRPADPLRISQRIGFSIEHCRGSLVEACRMTAKCSSSCQVGSILAPRTFPASRQSLRPSSASTQKALGLKLWTPVSAVMPCSSDPLRLRHIILRFG